MATRPDTMVSGGILVSFRGETIIRSGQVYDQEQMRGWMAYLARARSMAQQITAYGRLLAHLDNYRRIPVLEFDEAAAMVFQRLRRSRLRIGTMDLKIAAIVLARDATLLSRNLDDFSQIPDLRVEDWTSSR